LGYGVKKEEVQKATKGVESKGITPTQSPAHTETVVATCDLLQNTEELLAKRHPKSVMKIMLEFLESLVQRVEKL
jgi:hypothetical protein